MKTGVPFRQTRQAWMQMSWWFVLQTSHIPLLEYCPIHKYYMHNSTSLMSFSLSEVTQNHFFRRFMTVIHSRWSTMRNTPGFLDQPSPLAYFRCPNLHKIVHGMNSYELWWNRQSCQACAAHFIDPESSLMGILSPAYQIATTSPVVLFSRSFWFVSCHQAMSATVKPTSKISIVRIMIIASRVPGCQPLDYRLKATWKDSFML